MYIKWSGLIIANLSAYLRFAREQEEKVSLAEICIYLFCPILFILLLQKVGPSCGQLLSKDSALKLRT